jgi:cytochrome c553
MLLALCAGRAAGDTPEGLEFFETRIRPLLVENCFKCHGGDKKKGNLQLDSRAGLLKGGDSGPALMPGQPDQSRLIQAVRYTDDVLRMPPKSKLSNSQIADLTAWVKMGAPWPARAAVPSGKSVGDVFDLKARSKHWSFQPVKPQPLPAVKNTAWPQTPLDPFVLAGLEANDLSPAATADRRTLLRRVTYDLIGLPPSLAEIESFLADRSPDAFSRVVDRLLASEHYGERWGRHWLDLVRYAETCGHEYDFDLPDAYGYRDYVIRAFNADVPYDQFVREHIAGDLLPEPRRHRTTGFNESILGTGFWFLGEAKHSPVDVRGDEADRIDNQIDVLSKTFLGLTVACARCHDHKFDAISTKDYYALAGYVESSRQQRAFIDRAEDRRKTLEQLRDLRGQYRAVAVELTARALRAAAGKLAERLLASRSDCQAGLMATNPLYPWVVLARSGYPLDPVQFSRQRQELSRQLRGQLRGRSDHDGTAVVFEDFKKKTYQDWFITGEAFGTGPTSAVDAVLQADPARPVKAVVGAGTAASGLISDRLQGVLRSRTFVITRKKILYHVAGHSGQVNLILDGFQQIRAPIYGGLEFRIDGGEQPQWHVQDVSMWPGHRAYIEIIDEGVGSVAVDKILFSDDGPPAEAPNGLLLRLLDDERVNTPEALARKYQELCVETVDQWRAGQLNTTADAPERLALLNWMLQSHLFAAAAAGLPEQQELSAKLKELQEQFQRLEAALPVPRRALAMADGTPWNEHVFVRGNPKVLGEEVQRRFLEALGGDRQPVPAVGSGRLELARRMTDPANPLLARVMVNRIWQHHFGEGIVRSVDNFGVLGERPTNPALLDYLAAEFVRQGWSVKQMHRLMLLSSTYQMASRSDDPSEVRDPQNKLWHRAPIRRLEAEVIRDAILAVSGRLDLKMYGPSVMPYLTPHMAGRGRPTTSGPLDGDGRRSIYLGVRRNFLTPLFLAFDYPVPFTIIGRRSVSNVPAQALALMNNPFVVQQAENWARRVLADPALTPAERVTNMYVTAFGRPPEESELAEALAFLDEQGKGYGQAGDLRAWADLGHVLFNVKEFIFLN